MWQAGWACRAIACMSLVGGGVSGFWVLGIWCEGLGAVKIRARSRLSVKEPTRKGPGGVWGRGGQTHPKYSYTRFPLVVSLLPVMVRV